MISFGCQGCVAAAIGVGVVAIAAIDKAVKEDQKNQQRRIAERKEKERIEREQRFAAEAEKKAKKDAEIARVEKEKRIKEEKDRLAKLEKEDQKRKLEEYKRRKQKEEEDEKRRIAEEQEKRNKERQELLEAASVFVAQAEKDLEDRTITREQYEQLCTLPEWQYESFKRRYLIVRAIYAWQMQWKLNDDSYRQETQKLFTLARTIDSSSPYGICQPCWNASLKVEWEYTKGK